MGFPTKIQLIKREKSEQWYINFPSALAQAMDFERGEVVEWTVQDKSRLILKRDESVTEREKKKPQMDH
jgi:bifunctional DNA-binding transcriptional regulator/antitoxin component of YhaV-PrlF toxin-antitoxin module